MQRDDENLLLLGAGAVGGALALPFIEDGIGSVAALEQQVTVGLESELDIRVDVTNDAAILQTYFVGASVRRPDGTIVDIESVSIPLSPGLTETVQLGPTDTGSLAPSSGGPQDGETIIPEAGSYDVIVSVFRNRVSDPNGSFGRVLEGRIARQEIIGAIDAQVQDDASIDRVQINSTQVF